MRSRVGSTAVGTGTRPSVVEVSGQRPLLLMDRPSCRAARPCYWLGLRISRPLTPHAGLTDGGVWWHAPLHRYRTGRGVARGDGELAPHHRRFRRVPWSRFHTRASTSGSRGARRRVRRQSRPPMPGGNRRPTDPTPWPCSTPRTAPGSLTWFRFDTDG